MNKLKFVVAAFALCGSSVGDAATVYDYVGRPFTRIGDLSFGSAVSGSVTVDISANFTGTIFEPSFSNYYLTTGSLTVSSANPCCIAPSDYLTFKSGSVTAWNIQPSNGGGPAVDVGTSYNPGASVSSNSDYVQDRNLGYNANFGSPGVWTASTVAEPSAWSAMIFGIFIGGVRLRYKQKFRPSAWLRRH